MPIENINDVAVKYDKQDMNKATFEQVLNIMGYVPVLSILSGAVRMLQGAINSTYHSARFDSEVEKALGLGAYTEEEQKIHAFHARKSYDYMKHSDMNVTRGAIECFLFFGIGNIACAAHDIFAGRNKYPGEKRSNVDLINTLGNVEPLKRLVDKKEHQELTARLQRIEGLQLYHLRARENRAAAAV